MSQSAPRVSELEAIAKAQRLRESARVESR